MKKYIQASNYIHKITPIYGGIQIDKENIIFNWDFDDKEHDVLTLLDAQSGEYTDDGVQYIYGYSYAPNATKEDKRIFRNYIKHAYETQAIYSEDLAEFVENGVTQLDKFHRLSQFQATVYTQSSVEYSVIDLMHSYLSEDGPNIQYSFELLKQTYEDVTFDAELGREALRSKGKTENYINKQIEHVLKYFESLKASGQLFQMKKFVPPEIRIGFQNFLKFKNKEEENLYMNLQGVDVLICDDFLTSGATVKEIIRYLRSFHDQNRLTVFVLVKQH